MPSSNRQWPRSHAHPGSSESSSCADEGVDDNDECCGRPRKREKKEKREKAKRKRRRTEKRPKKEKRRRRNEGNRTRRLAHRLRRFHESIINADEERKLKRQLRKVLVEEPGIDDMTSSLLLASSSGDLVAVALILGQNSVAADVNGCNKSSLSLLTPLHVACLLADGAMAALLVRHGADEFALDANGETPSDVVPEYGGLMGLLAKHESALVRAESDARALERERRQSKELAAERAASKRDFAERLADAASQDQYQYEGGTSDRLWGAGWDDDETERAEERVEEMARYKADDWMGRIAEERSAKRRKEASAEADARRKRPRRKTYGPYVSNANKGNTKSDNGGCGAAADGDQEPSPGRRTYYPAPNWEETAGFRGGEGTSGNSNGDKAEAPASVAVDPAKGSTDPAEIRATDNRAWQAFTEKWAAAALLWSENTTTEDGITVAAPMLHMVDVPWPSAGDDSSFPDATTLSRGERKVLFRQLQRRWHPDKFVQKFTLQLADDDREAVLRRVTTISQAINSAIAEYMT